jgi:hypothetical protein
MGELNLNENSKKATPIATVTEAHLAHSCRDIEAGVDFEQEHRESGLRLEADDLWNISSLNIGDDNSDEIRPASAGQRPGAG